jgi:hypothetical protein
LNLGFEALKIRLELLPEPLVTGQPKTVEHTVVFAPGQEAGAEKILPALAQMTEELLLVLEHTIQTTIKSVLFYQQVIFIQEISHRALLKLLPVQPPFAPRINESIADQGLQNMLPASSPRRSAKRSARTHPIPAARKDGRPANRLPTAEADAVPSL